MQKDQRNQPGSNERDYFVSEFQAIKKSGVPIASVWEYDRKTARARLSLTFDTEHSYMLQTIADFDRELRAQE